MIKFDSFNVPFIIYIIAVIIVVFIGINLSKQIVIKRNEVKQYCKGLCFEQTINDYYICVNECYEWRIK